MKRFSEAMTIALVVGLAVSGQAAETTASAKTAPQKPVAATAAAATTVNAQASPKTAPVKAAKPLPAGKQTPAEELSAAQKAIGDLTADFTLTISGAGQGGQDVNAQGKVWLASGRRYRVQYFQPERQLLVSDGTKRWLYLEKINQVQIQALPASGDANEFFLELGGGLPALVERCLVTRLAAPKKDSHGKAEPGPAYALVPKPGSGLNFQQARIWLSAEDQLPRRVVVEAGHRVEARFKNVAVHSQKDLLQDPDAGLPATLFTFAPPKDAEVIEMLWPGLAEPAP